MTTVFVLTREINEYDQCGEYFVEVFAGKPSRAQLIACDVPEYRLDHVLNGGGRVDEEYEWFNLRRQRLEPAAAIAAAEGENHEQA